MQADEAQRSGSLLQLTQAGVPLRAAMQILGYDNIADIVLPGDLAAPESTPVEAPTNEGTVAPEGMTATTKAVANEWALLSKKIERRIKSGRDPRTSFDSALIPADHVDAVMAHCYKGMTVADVHDVIHAVKAPVDDMTPDELRIYNRIIKEMRKKGEQWARDIANERNPETSLRDVIKPVLDSELGTTMGKRIDRLGTQFNIPMDTGDQSRYIQQNRQDHSGPHQAHHRDVPHDAGHDDTRHRGGRVATERPNARQDDCHHRDDARRIAGHDVVPRLST